MKNRYPTAEELYALEREARRMRALEVARLVRAGTEILGSFFRRIVTSTVRNAKGPKGLHHA
jgi:hypothetical protein